MELDWIALAAALCSNEAHELNENKDYIPRLCQLSVMNCVVHKTKVSESEVTKKEQLIMCYLGWNKAK